MLIIKAKNIISKEKMEYLYNKFLEQIQLGLILVDDDYEFSIVEPSTEWIPVSERLPDEYKTVIASSEYGVYPEARYSKEYGWEWAYESGADYWEELECVNAWMPLPEPYKVKEIKE